MASTPERIQGLRVDAFLYVGGAPTNSLLLTAAAQLNTPPPMPRREPYTYEEMVQWLWDDEREKATPSNDRLWRALVVERMGENPSWKEQQSARRRESIEMALRIIDEGAFNGNFNVTRLRAALAVAP